MGITPLNCVEIMYCKAPTLLTTASDWPLARDFRASWRLAYFVYGKCRLSRYSAPEEFATAANRLPARSPSCANGPDSRRATVMLDTRIVVTKDISTRLVSIQSTAMKRPVPVLGVLSPYPTVVIVTIAQ